MYHYTTPFGHWLLINCWQIGSMINLATLSQWRSQQDLSDVSNFFFLDKFPELVAPQTIDPLENLWVRPIKIDFLEHFDFWDTFLAWELNNNIIMPNKAASPTTVTCHAHMKHPADFQPTSDPPILKIQDWLLVCESFHDGSMAVDNVTHTSQQKCFLA